MEKKHVCDVPEKEAKEFLGVFELKNTLESLAILIADNNKIMKDESDLYGRLVEDYKQNMIKHNQFWSFYLEKYGHMLSENTQLSLDFKTNIMYIIPSNY